MEIHFTYILIKKFIYEQGGRKIMMRMSRLTYVRSLARRVTYKKYVEPNTAYEDRYC